MSKTTQEHKKQAPRRLRFGVFICTTSRYQAFKAGKKVKDESGELIANLLLQTGQELAFRTFLPDDKELIQSALKKVLDSKNVDVVVFSGGTGISPKDVTIEAVEPFMEKTLPGFGELFRWLSYEEIGSASILTRAFAGIAKGKVVFCIPGSPNAVKLCFEKLILPEASHILKHSQE
jgi:molybdenum cofactor biosynthesis protein B